MDAESRIPVSRRLVCTVAFSVVCLIVPGLHGQDHQSDPPSDGPASLKLTLSSPAQRNISPLLLPINILRDQKSIWLFPGQLAKRRHWWPTLAVVGTTAALVEADPYVEPAFNRTTAFRGFNRAFSSKAT